ncbi:TetR/AcrR family transcriptional regulator [Winkia sp. ACRQY]|uniref:TetR/AcrR family transcriptional regulator n=1 Tax=Winkia TaxID=2692118 RepID=UPI000C807191|nr:MULTISPECIES: TetR/AcrR family transcriptional regulator [Winkia]PMC94102.1 hypothetical protein CJ188_02430 [Actinomyces sp. UMB0918]MCG7302775.1 TetR/AcrR family transcriptional regulator [Winkia sp. ACRQY]MDK7162980.1 TetR/AcrR family transcriptional regulator [Winkia sp. UMB3105]MDK8594587.1 TetR/AcrR family transcriptional regulator [Winkia sp. UMB1096A]MDU2269445.1 TetR/AcrR family transcriptional regulator [Winkia neuii]
MSMSVDLAAPTGWEHSKREATRQALLEGGLQLVIKTGIPAMTVGTISEAAGFTRGAFYYNFVDKSDFVSTLIGWYYQHLRVHTVEVWEELQTVLEGIDMDAPAPKRAETALTPFLDAITGNHRAVIAQEMRLYASRDQHCYEILQSAEFEWQHEIEEYFQRIMDAVNIKCTSSLKDLALLARTAYTVFDVYPEGYTDHYGETVGETPTTLSTIFELMITDK